MRAVTLRPVAGSFLVFGGFAGAWSVAAVDVERSFHLSDAALGGIIAIGILLATGLNAVGGILHDRWGPNVALARALLVWAGLLVAQAAAPVLGAFAPLFVLGFAVGGLVDVVMNVVAAAALAPRPGALVRFHGLFNAGAVLGAGVTGLTLGLGASWRIVWFLVAALGVVLGIAAGRSRLPSAPPVEHPSMLRAVLGLRHEGLVVLAAVFAASALVEGGIATFGVLYLRANLGMGVAAGVGAYVVGQALATVTRFGSAPLVGGLGSRRGVALGGGLTAVGLALEALSPSGPVAASGLALACVGIAVVWPLLIADVSNEARHPALAIGGVTAAGYLGMVAGPALVGLLSGLFDLTVGILLLAGFAFFVAVTPAHVRPPRSVGAGS